MWTRATATRLGLVLLGVVLVVGFHGVLEKRFAAGDVYPYYASFRSDPLGTSVFYESLEELGTVEVSRNLTNLNTVEGLDADTAILLLGYPRDGFEDLRAPADSPVIRAVEEGARLVITMNPELVPEAFRPGVSEIEEEWIERRRRIREDRAARRAAEIKEEGKRAGEESETPAKEEEDSEESEEVAEKPTDQEEEEEFERQMEATIGPRITKRLGFSIPASEAFERPAEGWETSPGSTLSGAMPGELPAWRSQYRLEARDEAWVPVVRIGEAAVVLERRFGKGTIVLASDTYFASNESLHLGAEPGFLLWLIGDKRRVVFDETIHGTVEAGGAMKLIRRYRAHGVFFGLLCFLALWAWRSAVPLVPGREPGEGGGEGGAVMGEGTGTGLIRLLRRSVPSADLLPQCVEVWSRSRTAAVDPVLREKIRGLVERHRRDPRQFGLAEAYRGIVDLLRKR